MSSLREYLSGTIYPDSRYVTKIDRNLTHNKNILAQHFAQSDFTSGWQVHCICDEIQQYAHRALFPAFHLYEGSKRWMSLTALKLFQDMNDAREIHLSTYLSYLDYVYNPNKEDVEFIKSYNNIIQETYLERNVTPKIYYTMCIKLGFDQQLTNELIETLEGFIADTALVKHMDQSYMTMMSEYNRRWRKST